MKTNSILPHYDHLQSSNAIELRPLRVEVLRASWGECATAGANFITLQIS